LSAFLYFFEEERKRGMIGAVATTRIAGADDEHFRTGLRMIAGGAL
jgi:hypothetical protein